MTTKMRPTLQDNRISDLSDRRWIKAGPGLALFALTTVSAAAQAATPAPAVSDSIPAETRPWAFNLNLYMWLPGVNGDFSAGPLSKSVSENFIDIVDASDRFPLGFMGRFEARYERFGLYLDGNWFDLDFKSKTGPRGIASASLESEMGILDYGLTYRVSGAPDLADWEDRSNPQNRLDVYVGGRTLWLENTIDPERLQSVTASRSFTSPVIGGRFFIDFTRDWFVKVDGNIGGFGAQNVSFTGGILGSVGYRASVFDVPTAFELGYKALRVQVDKTSIETDATMNGPFVGMTAFW